MHRLVCPLVVAAALLTPIQTVAQPGGLPDLPRQSFGLIEVGASRVAFIQADAWVEGGKVHFQVKKWGYKRPRGGLTQDRKLIPAQVDLAAQDVADLYHTELRQGLKVEPDYIMIIADSHYHGHSADDRKMLVEKLNAAIKKKNPGGTGPDVAIQILTPLEEGQYRAREMQYVDPSSIVSTGEYAIVDVNAGPTTIAYKVPKRDDELPQIRTERDLLPGSMELTYDIRDDLRKQGKFPAGFPDALPAAVDRLIEPRFSLARETKPGFANFDRHYIIGDLASALPVLAKPKSVVDRDPTVKLTHADILALEKRIMASRTPDGKSLVFPPLEIPEGTSGTDEQRLRDEYNQLKDAFTPEQLASAVAIIKTYSTTFQLQGGKKEIHALRETRYLNQSGEYIRNSQYILATGFLRYVVTKALRQAARKGP